ncbi:MAG: BON domain-containing protein [Actinobacteria bacterium]|nr:MAG: BON domain-containing protein [Actinomycetota bacterium]
MRLLALGGLLGAALAYLFDPDSGRRRRALARDRSAGTVRSGRRQSGRLVRRVSSDARGVTRKLQHRGQKQKPQPNDATLARTVESEIFRDPDVPKGKIDVNAENGIVFLRGEAERPEMIDDLEQQVRKVPGVQGVENLLHLPGEPAPARPATS